VNGSRLRHAERGKPGYRGLSVRDIQAHLKDIYGTEVSPDLISRVTDAVMDEVTAWQSRPLSSLYAVVYLDALVVKVRHGGSVQNRSAYLGIGITLEGTKEILGLWLAPTEGENHSFPRVSKARTQAYLHDERDRIDELSNP